MYGKHILPNVFHLLDYLIAAGQARKEPILELLSNIKDFLRFRGMHRQAQRYLEAGSGLDMLADAVEMYGRINDPYSIATAYFDYAGLLAEKTDYRNKTREL